MRDELNIPRSATGASSVGNGGFAPMGPGGVNASFRVPRRHDTKAGNPRKMYYVAAGLALVIGAFMLVSALTTAHHGGVPVVEADKRPLRVKPETPGGMTMEGGDEALLANEKDGNATLAPAPEAPAPAALKKQALEAAQAEAARLAAVQPPVPAVVVAPPQPLPVPLPVPAPAPVAVARVAAVPAAAKPAPIRTALAAPNAVRVAASIKPAVAPGGRAVQLAALVSEQGAQAEWERLAKKFPELFAGRKPVISKLERDGKTFWRLRTAGFASPSAAAGFCEKAKASGLGCLIEKS